MKNHEWWNTVPELNQLIIKKHSNMIDSMKIQIIQMYTKANGAGLVGILI